MEEVWKSCITFPGYSVNEKGEIRNDRTNNILKGVLHQKGYHQVGINVSTNGEKSHFKMIKNHILVADAWLGVRPENLVIDHKNRNRLDNNPSNLHYVTLTENRHNSGVHKNNKLGEKHIIYDENLERYLVNIMREGKKVYCSSFKNLEEAIKGRDTFLNEGEKIQVTTATGQKNIHKHGNGFRVSFEKKVDGKKVRVYNKTFPTLDEAIKARDEFKASQ